MSGRGLNETHEPGLRSWVESANTAGHDFPIQNLPFGLFRSPGSAEGYRGGVAIGDWIVDLAALWRAGVFEGAAAEAAAACAEPTLNALMAAGPQAASALRLALSRALRVGASARARVEPALRSQHQTQLALPARIGDFSDFYSSIHHARAVGRLFRPAEPLTPNYRWLPIGYHGRSSSIAVSGQEFARPRGQRLEAGAAEPRLEPSRQIDYELELGLYVGRGNAPGASIGLDEADAHLFGVCLLNDWSARDLQRWESAPLGPFLGKSFATTVSPWIVTLEALEPYRQPWTRDAGDPPLLPYLDSVELRRRGALDIQLEAWIQTAAMRAQGTAPTRLSHSSYRHAYWSAGQLLAHHTVNGCNLQAGDLLGTGTQSGPTPAEAGSLLERTRAGREPLLLPDGEQRGFLEDGDTIILRGYCERPGAVRIGLGEALGRVLPARPQ